MIVYDPTTAPAPLTADDLPKLAESMENGARQIGEVVELDAAAVAALAQRGFDTILSLVGRADGGDTVSFSLASLWDEEDVRAIRRVMVLMATELLIAPGFQEFRDDPFSLLGDAADDLRIISALSGMAKAYEDVMAEQVAPAQ